MKIDINLDYEEKQQFSKTIKDYIEKELKNNLTNIVKQGIELDTDIIKEVIQDVVTDRIKTKLDPYINRICEKFENELCILNQHLIKQNEKILDLFSSAKNLDNVKFEFLNYNTSNRLDAEQLAIKYYESQGLKAFKFNQFFSYDISEKIRKTIEPFLSRSELKGAPDLIVVNPYSLDDGLFFLVEVKTNGDGVKAEQMLWYKNHPSVLIKVLYINQLINGTEELAEEKFF